MFRTFLATCATCIIVTSVWLTFIRPSERIIPAHDPYPAGLDSLVVSKQKLFGLKDEISGTMSIISDTNGTVYIRLSDFVYKKKFPVCPDLSARLSVDKNRENSIYLGTVRATEGELNFTVPKNEDYKMYTHLILWCETFNEEFAHADLIPKEEKGLFIK